MLIKDTQPQCVQRVFLRVFQGVDKESRSATHSTGTVRFLGCSALLISLCLPSFSLLKISQ